MADAVGARREFGRCAYCAGDGTVWWNGRRWLCRPCYVKNMGEEPPE